jgi:hypothetical protein
MIYAYFYYCIYTFLERYAKSPKQLYSAPAITLISFLEISNVASIQFLLKKISDTFVFYSFAILIFNYIYFYAIWNYDKIKVVAEKMSVKKKKVIRIACYFYIIASIAAYYFSIKLY